MEISGLSLSGSAVSKSTKLKKNSNENNKNNNNRRRRSSNNEGKHQETKSQLGRKPTGMKRAKYWDDEVEENFRLQNAGWRELNEYINTYGEPERHKNGYISCLRLKENGYFTYWSEDRECEPKYLNRVKIYTYGERKKSTTRKK